MKGYYLWMLRGPGDMASDYRWSSLWYCEPPRYSKYQCLAPTIFVCFIYGFWRNSLFFVIRGKYLLLGYRRKLQFDLVGNSRIWRRSIGICRFGKTCRRPLGWDRSRGFSGIFPLIGLVQGSWIQSPSPQGFLLPGQWVIILLHIFVHPQANNWSSW